MSINHAHTEPTTVREEEAIISIKISRIEECLIRLKIAMPNSQGADDGILNLTTKGTRENEADTKRGITIRGVISEGDIRVEDRGEIISEERKASEEITIVEAGVMEITQICNKMNSATAHRVDITAEEDGEDRIQGISISTRKIIKAEDIHLTEVGDIKGEEEDSEKLTFTLGKIDQKVHSVHLRGGVNSQRCLISLETLAKYSKDCKEIESTRSGKKEIRYSLTRRISSLLKKGTINFWRFKSNWEIGRQNWRTSDDYSNERMI